MCKNEYKHFGVIKANEQSFTLADGDKIKVGSNCDLHKLKEEMERIN